MARKSNVSGGSSSKRITPRAASKSRSDDGRSASQKTEKYRFAQNVEGMTAAEREYREYASSDDGLSDPDVLLSVPVVKVDRIHLELDNLDAQVALKAQVLDLLELTVGVDAHLGKLRIDIEGVEAQALVKVRLDRVAAIVDRILTVIDRNPELVENLSAAVEHVGSGAGETLEGTGEGLEQIGEGAGETVGEVGEGAAKAVEGIGEGAGQAVEGIGEGAGQAVESIGRGAGEAAEGAGHGAGQAVGGLDQTVGNLGQTVGQVEQGAGEALGGAGQAVGGLGQGVGDAAGRTVGELGESVGDAAGGLSAGAGGNSGSVGNGGGGAADVSAPQLAKEAVKTAARQLGSAAADEAKDLSVAATRKVMEMGERRREKRADKPHATAAALREAADAGVDVEQIKGTGADGRVILRDVQKAQRS